MGADAAVEFLLALLLLLSLNKWWYLCDHVVGLTDIVWCELSRCSCGPLATTLRNESLSMQISAHYWHARMLAHLRRITLQLRRKSYSRWSTITDAARHSQIRSNAFVSHDILLRNVAKLSVVRRREARMRRKLLLERSFATAKTTTLLSLPWCKLSWVRCVTCACVVQTLVVPLQTWLLWIWIRKLSPLLLLGPARPDFVLRWCTIAMVLLIVYLIHILNTILILSHIIGHIRIIGCRLLCRLGSKFSRGRSWLNLSQGWVI